VKNTIEALDKFTQALDHMLPPASTPLPGRPDPTPIPDLRDQNPPRRDDAVITGPLMWDADSCAGDHPVRETACAAGAKVEEPEESEQPAISDDGITRKGPRGDWRRPVRLAVIVLTVGLGFRFLVGVSARAGESYAYQAVRQVLAGSPHDHPARSVARRVSSLHHHASKRRRTGDGGRLGKSTRSRAAAGTHGRRVRRGKGVHARHSRK
jgi:hypothetical protein